LNPVEFLAGHPPFDRLGPQQLRLIEDGLEIAYLPRGSHVLRRGGPRSEHLHVVRRGVVQLERDGQLLQLLEEGESFGFPSLIGKTSPHVDVVAVEDTLEYRIPDETFQHLMAVPRFAEYFLIDLSSRLRQAASLDPLPVGAHLSTPASRLSLPAPASVSEAASVSDAARAMSQAGTSGVLVQGAPPGIVTDRDLRGRVLAAGLGPQTPVREVMSRPVLTLPVESSLFEVLVFMLEHGIHHVPLTEDDRVVALVTDTDLLRLQAKTPLYLLRAMDRADAQEASGDYTRELAGMVEMLFWSGLDATQIGRVVARLNDALVSRLLRRAEAELGLPPVAYAWLALGSEGRTEQALITDQDNALVYDDGPPDAGAYFGALAQRVVEGLAAASFPPCRDGFMATQWRRPLSVWLRQVRGWVEAPAQRATLEANCFLDLRKVHGSLDLEPLLHEQRELGREPAFLARLARATLALEPPLGLLRNIRADQGGVDLKKGGLLPIVGLARLHALEAGAAPAPTLERLRVAYEAGLLDSDQAATLAEAFRFLLKLRLREQLGTLRAGGTPTSVITLESLTALERRHLKETFVAIKHVQQAAARHHAVERLS